MFADSFRQFASFYHAHPSTRWHRVTKNFFVEIFIIVRLRRIEEKLCVGKPEKVRKWQCFCGSLREILRRRIHRRNQVCYKLAGMLRISDSRCYAWKTGIHLAILLRSFGSGVSLAGGCSRWSQITIEFSHGSQISLNPTMLIVHADTGGIIPPRSLGLRWVPAGHRNLRFVPDSSAQLVEHSHERLIRLPRLHH